MAGACPLQVLGNLVWVIHSSPDVSPPKVPYETWMDAMAVLATVGAWHCQLKVSEPSESVSPPCLFFLVALWLKATRKKKAFS